MCLKYGCVVEVCTSVCPCLGMSVYTWELREYSGDTPHLVDGIVCVVKGNIWEFVWEGVKVRLCGCEDVCVCVWVL